MAAAVIKINGVAGSNDDLPIDTLVQLDNQNAGGELTFTWIILDQPPGAVDALSATNIQNPTFTPKKEGTYLIKLTVNQTLPSEVSQTKIAGIRYLKTRQRNPAAGETIENGSRGWAGAAGPLLNIIDQRASDAGDQVGVVATGAPNVNVNDVVRASATETLKLGLPGQEVLAGWATTNALLIASVDQMLGVCTGAVDGSAGPYAPGKLIKVRIFGIYTGIAGAPVLGAPVYVSDVGTVVDTPGTVTRQIGNVTRVGGGTYDVWLDGTFGATVGVSGSPPVNVDKSVALAGSGAAAAFNHKHDISTAAPATLLTIGITPNAEGVGAPIARASHTHAIGFSIFSQLQSAAPNFGPGGATADAIIGVLLADQMRISLPFAGTWLVHYSLSAILSASGTLLTTTLYNATAATAFLETQRCAGENSANGQYTLAATSLITIGAAAVLEVRYRVDVGTVLIYGTALSPGPAVASAGRTLLAIKVA